MSMKCSQCGNEISDSLQNCSHCNRETTNKQQVVQIRTQVVPTQVVVKTINTDTKEKEFDKQRFFKWTAIIGGIIFFLFALRLIILFFYKNDNVELKATTTTEESIQSLNIGNRSTYSFPANIGEIILASFYDSEAEKYTNVDVYGNRYIYDEELINLVSTYAGSEVLTEGFYWAGFEYTIKFNDLFYLNERSVSPLLDTSIYQLNGNDFFLVGDHYYKIKVIPVDDGLSIKNGESATIKVLYQVPLNAEYAICFGIRNKTMGCFK